MCENKTCARSCGRMSFGFDLLCEVSSVFLDNGPLARADLYLGIGQFHLVKFELGASADDGEVEAPNLGPSKSVVRRVKLDHGTIKCFHPVQLSENRYTYLSEVSVVLPAARLSRTSSRIGLPELAP